MASNWKKLLKEAASGWSKAVAEAKEISGGSDIPDGRYYGILTNAEIVESNSSGRTQIAWEVVIAEGDYDGEIAKDYDGLETENNLKWLARKLALLGVDVENMDFAEDLEDVLEQLTEMKPKLKIRLRTKSGSDYQNMYFDQVVEESTNYGKASKPAAKTPAKSAAPPAKSPVRGGKTKPAPEPEPEEDDEEDEEEVVEEPKKPIRSAKTPPAKTPPTKPAPKKPEPEPEPEEDDEEGELIEVQVGMKVEAVVDGKVVKGEVVKLLNDGTIARIKTEKGKQVSVPIDEDFLILEDEETDD